MKRSSQAALRRAAVLILVAGSVLVGSNGRVSGAANVVHSLREWTRESPACGSVRVAPGSLMGDFGRTWKSALPPVVLAQQTFGERLVDLLLLRQYNTRVVLLGTCLLGVTAGVVGVFMVLRKQALVGDVVGHAALPGIAIAFLVMELIHAGSGKSLPGLLAGAFVAGLAGAVCVLLIDRYSRIKSDAALAIVLSVFYGAGAALFSVVQRVPSGSVAGLGAFLNGKTAALVAADVWLFAAAAVVVLAVTLLLFKELTLLCFDDEFAAAEGWPVFGLDALLIGLVAAVAIIGMQSVGLILVVAILIIPAAAARFWTDDVRWMTALSAAFGATGSGLGVGISALFPRIAAGAVIVLCGGALFAISLCFGRRRGVIGRWMAQRRLEQTVAEHDLLRAVYEHVEAQTTAQNGAARSQFLATPIDPHVVQAMRAWPPRRLATLLDWAASDGLLRRERDGAWRLTEHGLDEATRVVRNHRLWEMYLIRYADVAPSRVDHAADMIEHVLDPAIIRELEELLEEREEHAAVPASPH